jgi:hypothetical protein
MKQVTARELNDLAAIKPRLVGYFAPKDTICITPSMRTRLVETIRHLRAVVRKKRDFTIT